MKNVFFATNDRYAPHLCAAMASILTNSKADFVFYIFNQSLSDETKQNIRSLRSIRAFEVEFVAVDSSAFKGFEVGIAHLSIEICYRLLMPELKPDVSRAIYLDCDLIVAGDLQDLWNFELGGNYCGAVMEDIRYDRKTYKRLFGTHPYFNSGVLLLNLDAIRRDFKLGDFLEIERAHRADMKYQDQDVLNMAFGGRVAPLDARWNVTGGRIETLINTGADGLAGNDKIISSPYIIHYAGPVKPWTIPSGICAPWHAEVYFHYLRMTPYAGLEASVRAGFKPFRIFLRYWWKHPFFFLRAKFYRQMHYKSAGFAALS